MFGGIGVRAGEQDHPLRDVPAGGPDLLAVDDEVVAVTDGPGLEGRKVGAGAGLAIALAPDHVAAEYLGQVLLLLLFGAVNDEGRACEAGRDAAGAWRARFCELAVEDELLHHAHACAAVLLRPGGGNPAPLGELFHELAIAGEWVLAGGLRRLLLDEGVHFGAECRLFRRVSELHGSPRDRGYVPRF